MWLRMSFSSQARSEKGTPCSSQISLFTQSSESWWNFNRLYPVLGSKLSKAVSCTSPKPTGLVEIPFLSFSAFRKSSILSQCHFAKHPQIVTKNLQNFSKKFMKKQILHMSAAGLLGPNLVYCYNVPESVSKDQLPDPAKAVPM